MPLVRGKGDNSGYDFNQYWGSNKAASVQIYIDDSALQSMDDRLKTFDIERTYKIDSAKAISAIARDLNQEAMPRSPYLYGVLREAHFSETRAAGENWLGVVTIDTRVIHHILGGKPAEYGARIHEEGRPWFEMTVRQEADRIVEKHAGKLVNAYQQLWGGFGGGTIMTASSIF